MIYPSERREQGSVEVQWPMLYVSDDVIGEGLVLDVSEVRCQVVGSTSVEPGMRLKGWIWPLERGEPICVEEARVLCLKEQEFELELRRLPFDDQRWLADFVETAEREVIEDLCRTLTRL